MTKVTTTTPTAAAAATSSEPQCNLFISGLPPSVDDTTLRSMTSPFGEVLSAKVMLNIKTGVSRGFGFVLFKHADEAAKCKQQLDRTKVAVEGGRSSGRIRISYSEHKGQNLLVESDRLYVRNIPSPATGLTGMEILAHFATFGTVVGLECRSCEGDRQFGDEPLALPAASTLSSGDMSESINRRMLPTVNPPDFKRVLFVQYDSNTAAQAAVDAVHNSKPFRQCGDCPLLAKLFEPESLRTERLRDHYNGTERRKTTTSMESPLMVPAVFDANASSTSGPSVLRDAGSVPLPPELRLSRSESLGSMSGSQSQYLVSSPTAALAASQNDDRLIVVLPPPAATTGPTLPLQTGSTTTPPTAFIPAQPAATMAPMPMTGGGGGTFAILPPSGPQVNAPSQPPYQKMMLQPQLQPQHQPQLVAAAQPAMYPVAVPKPQPAPQTPQFVLHQPGQQLQPQQQQQQQAWIMNTLPAAAAAGPPPQYQHVSLQPPPPPPPPPQYFGSGKY